MTSTGDKVYYAECASFDPLLVKQVMDQDPEASDHRGLFGWAGVQMDGVCELHLKFLKELFKISKQINPGDLKHALERLDNFHANKLLRPAGIRSCRQEAQGITNMMSHVNRKRRNSIDCSRQPPWMQELIHESSGSPSSSSAKRTAQISRDKGKDVDLESILQAFDFGDIAIGGSEMVEVSSQDDDGRCELGCKSSMLLALD
eukprot:s8132_g3.t1